MNYSRSTALSLPLTLLLLSVPAVANGQQPADTPAGQPSGSQNPASGVVRIIDIQIPDDFTPATRNAAGAAATLNSEPHLGGLKFAGTVEAQMRKEGPVTVFITSMVSAEKVAYPDAAIQSEFELLRTAPERGSLSAKDVEIVSWKTDLVDGGARADLHWRHLAYETETHARALAYREQSGLLDYAQVECIHPLEPPDAPEKPLGALCDQLLATMAIPDPASGTRPSIDPSAIVTVSGQTPAPGDASADATAGDPAQRANENQPSSADLPKLSLRDPRELGDQPMPVIPVTKPEKRDYRQLLYLLGGILLVVGFYLSTRSRNAAAEEDDDRDRAQPDDDDSDDSDDDSDDSDEQQPDNEEES